MMALHVVAPPVGVAVDIALAANDALAAVAEHGRRTAAASIALAPRFCLGKAPRAATLALQIAGTITSVLPGKGAGAVTILAPFAARAVE
jgi:hypothetical protein